MQQGGQLLLQAVKADNGGLRHDRGGLLCLRCHGAVAGSAQAMGNLDQEAEADVEVEVEVPRVEHFT